MQIKIKIILRICVYMCTHARTHAASTRSAYTHAAAATRRVTMRRHHEQNYLEQNSQAEVLGRCYGQRAIAVRMQYRRNCEHNAKPQQLRQIITK
jgi:hypothetical protein